ncbi:MAG TPA: hypothetical protein VJP45_12960 [Candidatus Limnocylindria bacterium]|nr:hypothetical protein [Candidatus Limnocylindria bacterium]
MTTAPRIDIAIVDAPDGWIANVTVAARTATSHVVRISRAEHERYGGGDVRDLLRRSFEFMLDREPNTSILREFDLAAIERYFGAFPAYIRGGR